MPNSIYIFLINMKIEHNVFRKITCFLFEWRWLLVFVKFFRLLALVPSLLPRQKGLDLKTGQAISQIPQILDPLEEGKKFLY